MNISFNSNMPGIKARRQSFGIGTLLFLLLFGAGFTAAGVFAIKSGKIDPNWTRVNGRVGSSSSNISNGSTTYAAVVTYEVKGQSYQVTSGTSSSVYPHIGDSRQVAYDPSQPNEAKIVGSVGTQGFLYIFPVVGIACLVLAPFAFIRSLRRSSDINHLIQNGQKLQGILVNIQSIGVNNTNSSYRIEVRHRLYWEGAELCQRYPGRHRRLSHSRLYKYANTD